MKKYIRWLFILGFVAFAAYVKYSNMMYAKYKMFVVLWLLASFMVVLGVVYFKDTEKKDP